MHPEHEPGKSFIKTEGETQIEISEASVMMSSSLEINKSHMLLPSLPLSTIWKLNTNSQEFFFSFFSQSLTHDRLLISDASLLTTILIDVAMRMTHLQAR